VVLFGCTFEPVYVRCPVNSLRDHGAHTLHCLDESLCIIAGIIARLWLVPSPEQTQLLSQVHWHRRHQCKSLAKISQGCSSFDDCIIQLWLQIFDVKDIRGWHAFEPLAAETQKRFPSRPYVGRVLAPRWKTPCWTMGVRVGSDPEVTKIIPASSNLSVRQACKKFQSS
jgi:hypothetical protein